MVLTTINLETEKLKKIDLAACVLHNILITKQPSYGIMADREDGQYDVIDGEWHPDKPLQDMEKSLCRTFSLSAKVQRELLKMYFNSDY